ncbi:hypothetical protein [Streptomyces sp. NPDC001980]|uniref:hypothetical protein n=1 Tax=Streptomyces sp. NPDC001980 TaxID=3157126 RepID=UPI003326C48B
MYVVKSPLSDADPKTVAEAVQGGARIGAGRPARRARDGHRGRRQRRPAGPRPLHP